METLLDLLQRYREKAGDKVAEKGGSIFTKACFLLALLLQDKHRAVVRSNSNMQTSETYGFSSFDKIEILISNSHFILKTAVVVF